MRYNYQNIHIALADANKLLSNGGYNIELAIHTAYTSTSIKMKNLVTGKTTLLLDYCSCEVAYLWLEGFNTAAMIPLVATKRVIDKEQKSNSGFVNFIRRWF